MPAAASPARPTPTWHWLPFDALSLAQLHDLLQLRQRVFCVEQDCAFLDIDGRDPDALHLLGERDGRVQAYLRVFAPGDYYAEIAIGRVVTAPERRGEGLGRTLFAEGLRRARAAYPGYAVRIGAQQRLRRFYQDAGFCQDGAPYIEDGIPHIEMLAAP